jgi:hypothetical protein
VSLLLLIELDAQGRHVAFTWRGVTYRGKFIHHWIPSDRLSP